VSVLEDPGSIPGTSTKQVLAQSELVIIKKRQLRNELALFNEARQRILGFPVSLRHFYFLIDN